MTQQRISGPHLVGLPTARERRERRQRVGREIAQRHDGVASRACLLAAGLTDHDIRSELDRGVWQRAGVHTIVIDGLEPAGRGLFWRALWESGPRSVLDGPSALIDAGLKNWDEALVHVSVPHNATLRTVAGVRRHFLRKIGDSVGSLRRTKSHIAAIRAAMWATTDRAAATILSMSLQQRLVAPGELLTTWQAQPSSPRSAFLNDVIGDLCDGAHSINELDVLRACRRRGLPRPTSQTVRRVGDGRYYLDLFWEGYAVHAEVQGAHHLQGLGAVDDATRANDLQMDQADLISLQIPVLGWRSSPERFLDQIEAALHTRGWRRSA
ncbi:MAG: hypothetical protein Q4G34_11265 [Micrococcus sp.]|nr:hypothetical protein [Micrococcus sp.]